MRRLMRFAAGLYPAAWRARYGEELEALLEDIGPVRRDVWNVAGGALKMQMTTWAWWKLVPAQALAGAIVMAVAAFTMQPAYQSSGVMRMALQRAAPGESPDLAMMGRMDDLRTKTLSRTALSKIIADERLYPRGVGQGTMEEAVAQMQRNVQI